MSGNMRGYMGYKLDPVGAFIICNERGGKPARNRSPRDGIRLGKHRMPSELIEGRGEGGQFPGGCYV